MHSTTNTGRMGWLPLLLKREVPGWEQPMAGWFAYLAIYMAVDIISLVTTDNDSAGFQPPSNYGGLAILCLTEARRSIPQKARRCHFLTHLLVIKSAQAVLLSLSGSRLRGVCVCVCV